MGARGWGARAGAFPRIRSFDSSIAPRRGERVRASGPRSPVDLPAIVAALAGVGASSAAMNADSMLTSREQMQELERRLRRHERELAAARARIAEPEAAAAGDY